MILIDNSQVILSSIFAQTKGSTNGIDESLVRHMTLNAYRNFKNKFSSKFGELVICEDSSNCWRKDHFPLYKANRKKNQNKSDVDWSSVYVSKSSTHANILVRQLLYFALIIILASFGIV